VTVTNGYGHLGCLQSLHLSIVCVVHECRADGMRWSSGPSEVRIARVAFSYRSTEIGLPAGARTKEIRYRSVGRSARHEICGVLCSCHTEATARCAGHAWAVWVSFPSPACAASPGPARAASPACAASELHASPAERASLAVLCSLDALRLPLAVSRRRDAQLVGSRTAAARAPLPIHR
jgi:hypothetical protein